jgi:hypothetical protein
MRSPDGRRRDGRRLWFVGLALLVGGAPLTSCGLLDPRVDVLLIGDSIMRQSGEYVEEALEARPDIDNVNVKNAGKNGTGLLTPALYDWHQQADDMIQKYEPDIVVVLFIGNYTTDDLYLQPDGTPVEGYTPAFFDAWGAEADALMEIITADDAAVWWVQPPPMIEGEGSRRVAELRATHDELAARWPGTGLIDGTAVLAGPDGGFASELPDANGQPKAVRLSDTVHLTAFGSQLLGGAMADAIGPTLAEAADQGAQPSGEAAEVTVTLVPTGEAPPDEDPARPGSYPRRPHGG